MKIPKNHSTQISHLLSKTDSSFFLSDWNNSDELSGIRLSIIEKALFESSKDINRYFFIDEMKNMKRWFSEMIFKSEGINISPENIAISSNGTATFFLVMHILSNLNKINAILISPVYFSHINLLKEMTINIDYIESINNGMMSFNFNKLEASIKKTTNLILINDPLFGTGISFGNENYEKLFSICKNHNITLIIDYIYGGMEWNNEVCLLNKNLVNHAINDPNVIFIESISKRLFLNGAKNSIIFSNSRVISTFEKTSSYTIGCLTNLQISLFRQIYDIENRSTIINKIYKNILLAKNNYEIIKSYVLNTDCFLSECDSGYFCLLYIPFKFFKCNNSMQIAEKLLETIAVLTIPHDRYLHFNKDHYCFRINLTLPTPKLISAIHSIISNQYN